MMRGSLAFGFGEPSVTAVLINPLATNIRARHFCERLGFTFAKYQDFDTDHCAVYRITREVKSPLGGQYPAWASDFGLGVGLAIK